MVKAILIKILNGKRLPVLHGSLKGIKLIFNHLIKIRNYLQTYEPEKQRAFDLFLNSKDQIFFDVGANAGLHSYYVAKKNSNLTIVAFEPLPENASYIKEMATLNRFSNIKVLEIAVASQSGESFFDVSDNNSKGMLSSMNTKLKVKTVSLDEYVNQTNNYPTLVKIDVEGAESLVLEGASELVKNRPPVFIIELHNPQQDKLVARFLTEHKYEIRRINPDAGCEPENLLLEIRNTSATWPDPDGVWGSIVAIPNRV